MFATDLRDMAEEPLCDRVVNRRYAEFLDEVEAVQKE